MFEEDDDTYENELKSDVKLFENYLNGDSIGFVDGDRIEAIIDHYLFNSNYQYARLASDFGINQLPFHQVFYLRKAQSLAGLGLISESIDILRQIDNLDNNQTELLLTKAALFGQIRDSKNAIKCFSQALEICEDHEKDEVFVDLALEYENGNDFKSAINTLKEALKFNPKNEIAFSELCYCLEKSGNSNSFLKQIELFLDDNPYSYLGWYQLGSYYLRSDNFEKAIWAFDYCLIINENAGAAYFNLGNAYLSSEKFHQAIESFNKCIEIDGEDPLALCYLGEAYENLHEYELSKTCYKKSIELSPDFSEPWIGLGIIEDLLDNTREAIILFSKALDLDPDNPVVNHLIGASYIKMGEMNFGMDFLEKSLKLDSSDMECLTLYMENLVKIDLMDALTFITSFNKENGQDTESWLWEVSLLWSTGSKEEALSLFAVCVENDKETSRELFKINPHLIEFQEFIELLE